MTDCPVLKSDKLITYQIAAHFTQEVLFLDQTCQMFFWE